MLKDSSDTPSRDDLVDDLAQTIRRLKDEQFRNTSKHKPMLTATTGRSVGEALILIKLLSKWGEFTKILQTVGLSQPMASICRRLARDWHIIEAGHYQDHSAEVAYQKLLKHFKMGYS